MCERKRVVEFDWASREVPRQPGAEFHGSWLTEASSGFITYLYFV